MVPGSSVPKLRGNAASLPKKENPGGHSEDDAHRVTRRQHLQTKERRVNTWGVNPNHLTDGTTEPLPETPPASSATTGARLRSVQAIDNERVADHLWAGTFFPRRKPRVRLRSGKVFAAFNATMAKAAFPPPPAMTFPFSAIVRLHGHPWPARRTASGGGAQDGSHQGRL